MLHWRHRPCTVCLAHHRPLRALGRRRSRQPALPELLLLLRATRSSSPSLPQNSPGLPDLLTPKTVRALSLGLRRHGGSSTSQQGSHGRPAAGSSAAGRTGGSSAAGSRAPPAAAQSAAEGEVNSPPDRSPARSTGLVGPTALGPDGVSSQQGLQTPAKAGADPGPSWEAGTLRAPLPPRGAGRQRRWGS